MKKVKLIPSLIMLMLCIGVLSVGIYALNPISNSIAGTISISAGKASLAITGYVDSTIVYSRTELHGGMDWTIDSSKLNFDASSYFFPEQVPSKEIKLVIENLSNVPYGVFFCDTAGINATSSNIKTTGEVKSGTTTIVNASMDYYKYISVADSNSTLDQVEMTITLSVANISTSAQSGSFKYYLNVEEYNSSLNTTEEFIKVDDSLTAIEASAYADNASIKNVIIPNTITSIGASAFSGCTGLKEITIPASVTTIGAGAFDGCTALEKIIVEAHSTTSDFGGSANLPELEDYSWYLNGELLDGEMLSYSSTKNIFTTGKKVIIPKKIIVVGVEAFSGHGSEAKVSGDGEFRIGEKTTIKLELTGVPSNYSYIITLYGIDDSDNRNMIKYWANSTAEYEVEIKEDMITEYSFSVEVEFAY